MGDPSPLRTRTRFVAALLALSLGLLACAVTIDHGAEGEPVPPQGWRKDRGPVIPHDSFPSDCSICHVSTSWREIRPDFEFDHAQRTGVPLLGAHADAECLRCHNDRGPVEAFARRGCIGCHEDVHRGKLGSACEDCHDEDDWRPIEAIAIHARTRFPLVGAHAATACWRCHEGAEVGNFDRTDTECVGCHRDDLATATSPDHAANGWTQDCQDCHVPTSWTGAGFNHSRFPLTGAHAVLDCGQCHVGGGFEGTPDTCVGCHLDDYQATTDPSHVAAGFPTTCQTCHGTSSWEGATFDHRFPIDSGDHAGFSCIECHPSPGSFRVFTCTTCHPQGEMEDEHEDVGGYVYESQACYACHPAGRD